MAEQEVTNTENRIWLPEDAIGLVTTSSELENVEGAWWVREARAAEGQAAAVDVQAVWDEAINLVKGLLPELERVNKVELEHGFIGTSYELGQTKDIIELLKSARDAPSPPTAPHEPHEYEQRIALSGQCDNGAHSYCSYPSRCKCECHQVSAPQREGELKS